MVKKIIELRKTAAVLKAAKLVSSHEKAETYTDIESNSQDIVKGRLNSISTTNKRARARVSWEATGTLWEQWECSRIEGTAECHCLHPPLPQ